MTKLVADKPIYYNGRTRKRGEVFEAQKEHADILLRTRQVRVFEDEADAADEKPVRARRRYKRRDMRAEG